MKAILTQWLESQPLKEKLETIDNIFMEQQTLREWLKLLPLQKRLQAIENIRRYKPFDLNYCLDFRQPKDSTLTGGFVFKRTRQGYNYWETINNKYFL
jgi:hypothetical protein